MGGRAQRSPHPAHPSPPPAHPSTPRSGPPQVCRRCHTYRCHESGVGDKWTPVQWGSRDNTLPPVPRNNPQGPNRCRGLGAGLNLRAPSEIWTRSFSTPRAPRGLCAGGNVITCQSGPCNMTRSDNNLTRFRCNMTRTPPAPAPGESPPLPPSIFFDIFTLAAVNPQRAPYISLWTAATSGSLRPSEGDTSHSEPRFPLYQRAESKRTVILRAPGQH
jgi:hypothetical protein